MNDALYETGEMATPMKPADLLRSAARLIETALARLHVDHDVCPTCAAVRYTNRDAYHVNKQFAETPRKLRFAAETLDDPAAAAARRKTGKLIESDIKRVRRQEAETLKGRS